MSLAIASPRVTYISTVGDSHARYPDHLELMGIGSHRESLTRIHMSSIVIGDSHCRHSAPLVSVIAEFDKIATGERTPGLLQSATRREPTEIDRREPETLDELLDERGRFGMVS